MFPVGSSISLIIYVLDPPRAPAAIRPHCMIITSTNAKTAIHHQHHQCPLRCPLQPPPSMLQTHASPRAHMVTHASTGYNTPRCLPTHTHIYLSTHCQLVLSPDVFGVIVAAAACRCGSPRLPLLIRWSVEWSKPIHSAEAHEPSARRLNHNSPSTCNPPRRLAVVLLWP